MKLLNICNEIIKYLLNILLIFLSKILIENNCPVNISCTIFFCLCTQNLMQSLILKEKQLNEEKDSNAQCILRKEMELSMKQNFLTQEANRYLAIHYKNKERKIILPTYK